MGSLGPLLFAAWAHAVLVFVRWRTGQWPDQFGWPTPRGIPEISDLPHSTWIEAAGAVVFGAVVVALFLLCGGWRIALPRGRPLRLAAIGAGIWGVGFLVLVVDPFRAVLWYVN